MAEAKIESFYDERKQVYTDGSVGRGLAKRRIEVSAAAVLGLSARQTRWLVATYRGRAFAELNIEIICANSSQIKG